MPVKRTTGHAVQDEGTTLAQAHFLNFAGAGVSVATAAGVTTATIAGGGGDFTLISDSILASNGGFDFTSIPGTYKHLKIIVIARSVAVATTDNVHMRFNGDSGANYDYELSQVDNGIFTGAGIVAQTELRIGLQAAASSPAGLAGVIELVIFDYARTTFSKLFNGTWTRPRGTAANDQSVGQAGGVWRTTDAITRVQVIGGAGVIAAGSRATLYGLG